MRKIGIKISNEKWFIGIISGILAGIISSFIFTMILAPLILDKPPNFIVKVEEGEMEPNTMISYGNEGNFYWKDSFKKYKILLDNTDSTNEVNDLIFIIEFEGDVFKLIHHEGQEINSQCRLMDSNVYLISGLNEVQSTNATSLNELLPNQNVQGSNKIIVNCERIGQKGLFQLEAFVDSKGSKISVGCPYSWKGNIMGGYRGQCDFSHSMKIEIE